MQLVDVRLGTTDQQSDSIQPRDRIKIGKRWEIWASNSVKEQRPFSMDKFGPAEEKTEVTRGDARATLWTHRKTDGLKQRQ